MRIERAYSMMDYDKLARKYGYTSLFTKCGSINKDFVAILDSFLLNNGKICKPCNVSFGDNRRIIEFLEYADSIDTETPKASDEIKKFDRELATWNK